MEYRIFGDTGAHFSQLSAGLEKIGVDLENRCIPEALTIIHCGDLVHKGPKSNKVIELVDELIENNPGQWIQLMGNHEAQYLDGIGFWNDPKVSEESKQTLNRWREQGHLRVAYALPEGLESNNLIEGSDLVALPEKPTLLSHGGVTPIFWESFLGSTDSAEEAADMLNSLPSDKLHIPGSMLGYSYRHVGPIWASCTEELWPQWMIDGSNPPFNQIHGHSSPYSFEQNQWWGGTHPMMQLQSQLNFETRLVTTKVVKALHVAVDPGYGKRASGDFQPSLSLKDDWS